jgi:hypothetical protein
VTARRGGATRTLAVGDEVSGDDEITTGADGSVVIELRHTGVRWALGPGQARQVAASTAWKSPKRSGGGGASERNAAAGRHAERNAADTGASADDPPPPELEEGDEESGGTGTAMALDEGKMGKKDSQRADGEYKLRRQAPAVLALTLGEATGPLDAHELAERVAVIGCDTAPGTVTVTVTVSAAGEVSKIDAVPEGPISRCLREALEFAVFSPQDAETTLTGTVAATP